jgi:hypothetical protein
MAEVSLEPIHHTTSLEPCRVCFWGMMKTPAVEKIVVDYEESKEIGIGCYHHSDLH